MRPHRIRLAPAALALGLALVSGGCVADPPPPAVVGEEDGGGAPIRQLAGGASLALSRLDEGLNPHLLADRGVDTDLLSELTLPSAFRTLADGRREMDTALLESAEVVTQSPFVVRYTIRGKAQWSDSVPVGAEDFAYLWRQMRSQPGVVDPAGYERVIAVRSGAGGKVVDVEFDRPYERWRALFSYLVPAHLLKDAPGGFQQGLRQGGAASAGPFMIRTADLGRGVLELVRNDRYWDAPPVLDQIVARRTAGVQALGQTLRAGPSAVGLVADTPVNRAVVGTVPGLQTDSASGTGQIELGFDLSSRLGAEEALRKVITAVVNPVVVGRIATGATEPVTTSFPFPAGTVPVGGRSPADVPAMLRESGHDLVAGRWTRAGVPLSVTIGVATGDDAAAIAAYTVLDQLHSAGIGSRVWELPAVDLYADALPHGLVDAVVTRQSIDSDPAVAAESRFRCPSSGPSASSAGGLPGRIATTRTALQPPPPDSGTAVSGVTPSTTAASTPTRLGESGAPARASGVSGVCDPVLNEALDAVLTAREPEEALRRAGQRVAELALRVPLVRPSHLVTRDAALRGFPPTGTDRRDRPDTEILRTAAQWRRE